MGSPHRTRSIVGVIALRDVGAAQISRPSGKVTGVFGTLMHRSSAWVVVRPLMLPSTLRLTFAKKSAAPHFWMGTSTAFSFPASALKVTVILFVLDSYATSSLSNATRAALTIVSIPSSRDVQVPEQ